MNRALLADLQRHQRYPSITLLMNTHPGVVPSASELANAHRLAGQADRRLEGDIADDRRTALVAKLAELIEAQAQEPSSRALAICVAEDYEAVVRLGQSVEERVVIDDTFATRDLVADLHRTAVYRVVAISDRSTRVFIGNRQRLVELRNDVWPMSRPEDTSARSWTRTVTQQLRAEHATEPLATVFAGVERSVRQIVVPEAFDTIGFIPGNHDRTSWVDLHHAAWPLVTDWLRTDRSRAMQRLDDARSARRYAGGVDEVWALANDGRVEVVVVEDSYRMAARVDEHRQLHPAHDHEAPDVVDDIVDDTIELVLRAGGRAVIVGDGELEAHGRIAAVLRY